MAEHIVIKPRKGWAALNFREVFAFRDLFFILFTRDIKLRYKQTALGVLWVVLQPLMTSVLVAGLFGKIAKLPSDGKPYLLFALVGMLPWFLFSQSVTRGSMSLVSNAHLISKVYFPRILLPFSCCAASLIDFFVSFTTIFLLLAWYQVPLTWNIFILPMLILAVFVFSLAFAVLTSAFNVYYRDTAPVVAFLLQLWMYGSPILYSAQVVPQKFLFLYNMNPMVGIIDAFRWSILGLSDFPWHSFGWATIFSCSSLILCVLIFRRIERFFADII